MNEQQQFLKQIEAAPMDEALRLVYSDWLLDHDQPEEAERQRQYIQQRRVLQEIADEFGHDLDTLINAGADYVNIGSTLDSHTSGYDNPHSESDINAEEYWHAWEVVTGWKRPEGDGSEYHPFRFSCSC